MASTVPFLPPLNELQQLDRLIHALERADDRLRSGRGEIDGALADGLAALGSCYGALSSATSAEAAGHLEATYDACLRGLGDAYGGRHDTLTAALSVLRAIRLALSPGAVRRAA